MIIWKKKNNSACYIKGSTKLNNNQFRISSQIESNYSKVKMNVKHFAVLFLVLAFVDFIASEGEHNDFVEFALNIQNHFVTSFLHFINRC